MRILLVEDQEASLRQFDDALAAADLTSRVEVTVARWHDAATEIIDAVDFDLAICDLHIPRQRSDSPELSEGIAVYEYFSAVQPGTPTILVTGSGDERRAREFAAERAPVDIFGINEPYPMADFVFKDELPDCIRRIQDIELQLRSLGEIELITRSSGDWTPPLQARALRIFARRNGAKRVEIDPLGGLSGAAALRATLLLDPDTVVATVFAKLGDLHDLEDEAKRYHEGALRLPAGAYAPLLDRVEGGAGRVGGLFYGLAEQHQRSLFEVLAERPEDGAQTVRRLREVLERWRDRDEAEDQLITTLRRRRIGSSDLKEHAPALGETCWAFERRKVPIRLSLQHGDLHGENVLVSQSGAPLLIDFANVEALPAAFDPVVLEMSLVFQEGSPFLRGTWPTPQQCERWDDLDAYLEGCPVPEVVRVCREWAMEEARTEASVYAVAYAEALRQILYSRRDPQCAIGIARSAARAGTRLLDEMGGGAG